LATAVRTERANRWQEYRETRDFAIRNRLVLENLGLVYRIARQFAALAPDAYEDMVQEGCLALIHAVERFRPEYGLQFSTYAYPVISGVIKNFLRDRRRLRGTGRPSAALRASSDSTPQHEDDGQRDTGETLTDPADLDAIAADAGLDFTDRVVDRVLTDALLASMPQMERNMLRQVFYEDLSQREVADRLARSASRISRVLRRALSRLRLLLVEVQKEEGRLTAPARAQGGDLRLFMDEETGLFGPGYLHRCLAGAIQRANTYRAPMTLALLRVPNGSGASRSSSLSRVANHVYRRVRVMDHVFRAGRRELALILPLSRDQTASVCGRLATPQADIRVTCALASYPEDAGSASDLLEAARRALARR